MTSRAAALATGAVAMALVVAQVAFPRTPLYHTWQYALALAIALVVALAYANAVRRGTDGAAGKRFLIAVAGAAIVEIAGLTAGLLGPDTATVIGTPGTVVPLPAAGAAAFFASADAASIARGDATIALRRRNASQIDIGPSSRRVVGESLFYLEPRPAAYIDAWDDAGRHLTVTQPTNASFLSPIVLFRDRQRIGQNVVPLDTFATPARHRLIRVLYFTPADLAGLAHRVEDASRPAVVLSVSDDRGQPLGIAMAGSGRDASVGGVRIRVTLGTYPALAVAAAPATWALIAGIALFAAGVLWGALPPRRRRTAAAPQSPGSVTA